ncbi:hypothetical protein BV898_05930 [Hypsibius exemplaris]|uniref:Uncharacterized protein n=1 Tax=Hypsibius exemplaris TaxID=2072580 RepID=A0A1W0WY60_HYPEX|nr:hypothetical protein BV898_05930 [Hypsibius exemplaris]
MKPTVLPSSHDDSSNSPKILINSTECSSCSEAKGASSSASPWTGPVMVSKQLQYSSTNVCGNWHPSETFRFGHTASATTTKADDLEPRPRPDHPTQRSISRRVEILTSLPRSRSSSL